MPFLTALLANFAAGALAARASGAELRATPRSVWSTRSSRAVSIFAALIAFPGVAYLLIRVPDWAMSYAIHAAALPSAASATLVLAAPCAVLAGFAIGASWLRDHRARWIDMAAVGCALGVLVLGSIARGRILRVGTLGQIAGGYGWLPLWEHDAFVALLGIASAWLAATLHLLWWLARRK